MLGKQIKSKALLKRVLAKIKPSDKEYLEEIDFANSLIRKIKAIEGNHVDVIVAGSTARNTHLRGDRDIDMFVLFPEELTKEDFVNEGLRIAKKVFRGCEWEEAFSEHPYIRGNINGYAVEIVPSYKVSSASQLKSAVDRTPFHNDYLQKRLTSRQRDYVRLLKQFLKGIGCYGAELKYNSVPGYVTELLILRYGDFLSCIKHVAAWRKNELIDLENYYGGTEPLKRFNSHLVIVDPVDRNRNVAAALSYNQYARFIAASQAFMQKPSTDFFFGKKLKVLNTASLKKILRKKEIIAVKLPYPKKALADIIWGQTKRLSKKISNQLAMNNFVVNREEAWTDEKTMLLLVFELEFLSLQRITKKIGPEVVDREHSKRFLEVHKKAVAGPRIENGRWIIEIERQFTEADGFLKSYLKKNKGSEKEPISAALRNPVILDEKHIVKLYSRNREFREFLTSYIRGKESFL